MLRRRGVSRRGPLRTLGDGEQAELRQTKAGMGRFSRCSRRCSELAKLRPFYRPMPWSYCRT